MAKVIELRNSDIKRKREILIIVFVVAGFIYFYYYAKKKNVDVFIHSMAGMVISALVGAIVSRLLYPDPTTKEGSKGIDSKKLKIIKLPKDESKSEQKDKSEQQDLKDKKEIADKNQGKGTSNDEDKDIDKILSEA